MIEQDRHKKFGPLFQANTDPVQLHVRCPGCMKLYVVNAAEIYESKPKFSCVGCQQKFWFPFPEAMEQKQTLMGFPLEWIEEQQTPVVPPPAPSAKPFGCPVCSAPYSGGDTECASCGIVFEKFEARRRDPQIPDASTELKELWDLVVNEYEKPERHDAFLAQALGEGALNYAGYRYQQILEINAADEAAQRAVKKIAAMSTARFEATQPVKVPVLQFKFPKLRLVTVMLALCAVVIVMGLTIPGARNLVGIGSSFLFMLLALRYYFRII